MPGAHAKHIQFPKAATSAIYEGSLAAGQDAEYVIGEEKHAFLFLHAISADAHLKVSLHRADSGEEVKDGHESPGYWSGRVPETLGYLIVVHGADKPAAYSLDVESPREVHWEANNAAELSDEIPAHATAAYVLPAASRLTAEILSGPQDAYVTLDGLDAQPIVQAAEQKRACDVAMPGGKSSESILRIHQGASSRSVRIRIARNQ